jgi:hypothetical protein
MPRIRKITSKNVVFAQNFGTPKATKNYFRKHYSKGATIVGPGTWKLKNGHYVHLWLFGLEEVKSVKNDVWYILRKK